jgi:4-amino-4-deoxy-L-arabinose transferase-like glycosyltransferase
MTLLQTRFAPLCVLLLALLSFGVGLAQLPVQDRDEARFAQASRQMAQTGDFIDIRLQEAPRHNKPVLIYWAQTAAIYVTGARGETQIWVHRLPSYLAGALSTLALIWAGTPIVGRRAAVVAGIICATIFMFHAEARTAKTDAALVLFVVLAMGALSRAWLNPARSWSTPLIFWTALAAGVLLKGPVVALPIIGAIVWIGVQFRTVSWLTRLRPILGLLLFAALVTPWFIAITIATDGAFWGASLGGDLTNKITAGGEHTGSPPAFTC